MRYVGGKFLIRKQVAEYLESVRGSRDYFEPFVGGAWVTIEMSGKRHASDINSHLITMWKALQDGWIPPDNVSEEMFREYKEKMPENDPLTAFIGFGCTYGGRFMQGFARQKERDGTDRNFALVAKNSLLKKLPKLKDVTFTHGSYLSYAPDNKLIYCDPPYENTKPYDRIEKFDHDLFRNVMRKWSRNNMVVISEFNSPEDFITVKEMKGRTFVHDGSGTTTETCEKLFVHESLAGKLKPWR